MLKDFLSKERLNPDIDVEIERTEEKGEEEKERNVGRSEMVYKRSNETYDFRKFKTIRVFGNEIRNIIINMTMANDDEQNQLLKRLMNLKVRQTAKF